METQPVNMVAPLEIGISCDDLDRMVRFYTDLMGCSLVNVIDMPAEKAKNTPFAKAGYRVGRLQTPMGERIKFLEPVADRAPVADVPEVLLREGRFFLAFIVQDLDTLLETLEAAGVDMLTGYEKIEVRPGFHLALAVDPEGNVIEFNEYADIASYRGDLAASLQHGLAS